MPLVEGKSPKSFSKNVRTEMHAGKPLKQSLAIAYSMKRKAMKHNESGGMVEHNEAECMANGGCAMHDGGDLVERVMRKRMSEGGMVANQEHGYKDEDLADFDENEFDDLVLRDDLEDHDTGKNSGDEIDDAQEDHDRDDIVARAMKSRKMKDKMPIAGYGTSFGKYK